MYSDSITSEHPKSEQSGSESLRAFRELLQLVADTDAARRVRAVVASRPADSPPGTFTFSQTPDGAVYIGWTAPLSDWLDGTLVGAQVRAEIEGAP